MATISIISPIIYKKFHRSEVKRVCQRIVWRLKCRIAKIIHIVLNDSFITVRKQGIELIILKAIVPFDYF